MKKFIITIIAIIRFTMPIPLLAQTQEKPLAYRAFASPSVSVSFVNDILAHLNFAVQDYYREFSRDKMYAIQNEQRFVQLLVDNGLFDTRANPRPREWEEVNFAIFIEKQGKKELCKISMVNLENGEYSRIPIKSDKPHHIAKSIALLLTEQITDNKQKKALKSTVNSYFSKFRNLRTIDLYYNGVLFSEGEAQILPISGGIGFTLPLNGPLCFGTRFYGTYYDKDQLELSAGMGLIIQKDSRISPEFALFTGYAAKIQNDTHNGGLFLEPSIGLGLYLHENFKISAVGSFHLAYSPWSQNFSTKAFAGTKISLGF